MKTTKTLISFTLILIITLTLVRTLPVSASSSEPSVEWQKTYRGVSGDSLVQASDGGFVIATTVADDSSGTQNELLKTDDAGNIVWNVSIGGPAVSSHVVLSS
jgi:hypothetical protein